MIAIQYGFKFWHTHTAGTNKSKMYPNLPSWEIWTNYIAELVNVMLSPHFLPLFYEIAVATVYEVVESHDDVTK